VTEDWAARGFSCDLWADPPGRAWEDFVHPTDEVVMVLALRLPQQLTPA
jgi:hypothetical protein